MGWTETHINTPIKDYFKQQYLPEPLAVSVMNRKEIYAAIPYGDGVCAVVWLFHFQPNTYFNFRYKDMDETCGPYEHNCPIHILNLLTPIDSEYANSWRSRCWGATMYRRRQVKTSLEKQFKYLTRGLTNLEDKIWVADPLRKRLSRDFPQEEVFKRLVEIWGARLL